MKRNKFPSQPIIGLAIHQVGDEMRRNHCPRNAFILHGAWMRLLRIHDYLRKKEK